LKAGKGQGGKARWDWVKGEWECAVSSCKGGEQCKGGWGWKWQAKRVTEFHYDKGEYQGVVPVGVVRMNRGESTAGKDSCIQ